MALLVTQTHERTRILINAAPTLRPVFLCPLASLPLPTGPLTSGWWLVAGEWPLAGERRLKS